MPQAGRKRKHENVDLESYKKESKFAEFWEEGTVQPLSNFLQDHDIDCANMSEQRQRKIVEEENLGN